MHALAVSRILSAHQNFKQQYGRTLAWSTAGALTALVLLVLLMPEFNPTPYSLPEVREMIIEDMQVIVPPMDPPDVAPPSRVREVMPVPNDDPGAVESIDDIVLVPFPDIEPVYDPYDDTGFVAASQKPRLVQGAAAEYPEMARLAGLQGLVMVKVLVETDGRVKAVEVLKGIHPLIDRPAVAAARRLVFEPGTQRGIAVPCWVAVPFRFTLD